MKVALVHDYLNQLGGGERVLEVFMELFPEAPIYTLLYDEEKTRSRFSQRKIYTSFLDNKLVRNHHRFFVPFMPLAARSLNLGSKYDLIISDTAGFAKGISYNPKTTKHISYIHTPLRYAWETSTYFNASFDGSALFKSKLFRNIFRPAFRFVKNFDYKTAQKPDLLIANSNYIKDKIKKYFGRDAVVVHPPVDTKTFFYNPNQKPENYFLAVGRFLHYKRFDLIIQACIQTGVHLKVVGAGREEVMLKKLAAGQKNIEFLPFQEKDEDLRKLYAGAVALLFANEEDFGLVMAEAQACGTPVLAPNRGGAREIIVHKKTGLLYHDQTANALAYAIKETQALRFNRAAIAAHAEQFSKASFVTQIQAFFKEEPARSQ